MMEILKFKTNIATESTLGAVAPVLEKFGNISSWKVDTTVTDKTLSISGQDINPQAIQNALREVGCQAELLRVVGLDGTDL